MARNRWVGSVALMCAAVATTLAVTNGQPDEGRHPYVGLMVALDADGVPQWRCSGSLFSAKVFLTAGHCTEPPATHAPICVTERPVPTDPQYLGAVNANPAEPVSCNDSLAFDGYPCQGDAGGTPHPHPDFCTSCGPGLIRFASHDVGVVVMDAAVPTRIVATYAQLPAARLVDTLANKTPVDFVGYGVQFQAQIPGNQLPQPPPFYRWAGPRQRMFAPGALVSGNFVHSAEFLRLSLNPGGGSGGTCFGDSGGPDLLGG